MVGILSTCLSPMGLHALPAFADNYIWWLDDDGSSVVVDPGDAAPVLQAVGERRPDAVLITHHHADHIGGVAGLRARWPDLPIYACNDPRLPFTFQPVADGEVIRVGALRFAVIATPGHTLPHVSFHGHGLLFCGDTLFSLGCGRLFEGTPAQMLASLQRLAALPDVTRVCCAHEYTLANAAFALTVDPSNTVLHHHVADCQTRRAAGAPTLPSTMAIERACNPFLRSDQPAIRAALQAECGLSPQADAVAAFAALRRWKDDFRA